MAVNPNTTFTAGNVLTASQMNRLPFGIVAIFDSTTASASIGTTETVTLTSSSFTAIANRYYRITYFEPLLQPSNPAPGYITMRIRKTDVSGAVYAYADIEPVGAGIDGQQGLLVAVTTFSAGATTVCGTLKCSSNTVIGYGGSAAGVHRLLIVEDIGPA